MDDRPEAAPSPPSLAPLSFSEEQPDVWARSSPSPRSPAAAVLSAVAHPLPASYLADFDPYAPTTSDAAGAWSDQQSANWTTLGATVQSSSKLEILPPDEDSPPSSAAATGGEGFEQLPTSFQVEGQGGPAAPTPRPPPKAAPSDLSTSAPPSSSSGPASFLGGVFRSMSGSGSPAPASINTSSHPQQAPATPSKCALAPPRHSDPPQPQGEHAEQSSSLPNPLASIASVFRSPLGSRTSSSAGTPPPGSSPTKTRVSEKMAEGAAAARRGSASGASSAAGKEKTGGKQKQDEEKDREEAQFDFNKFLEQMRSRSADPIAKYLRSFLKEFSRRPPISTADQIRVINDFLDFIAVKMRSVEPWRGYFAAGGVGDKEGWSAERREAEFEVAGEAMEKLVMNRVWHLTFTPALDLSTLSSFPGQTSSTGDIERDAILAQRIKLFAWIKPSHLDLPIPDPVDGEEEEDGSRPATPKVGDLLGGGSEGSEKGVSASDSEKQGEVAQTEQQKQKQRRQVQSFVDFARRELGKMNQYKAPRDKLICVLNCCKVIFGLIRSLSAKEEGADTFIPFLIYVVLKANPEHLVSNLQYIQRFRNPEKLSGEGGYYLSSLNGAISFIETVDASSLSNITQEEFETNVATAIRNLPQPEDSPRLAKPSQFPSPSPQPPSPNPNTHSQRGSPDLSRHTGAPERQHRPRPQVSTNVDAPLATPDGTELESPSLISQPGLSFPSTAKGFLMRSTDSVERAMSKPLGAIGRIFDQLDQRVQDTGVGGRPPQMDGQQGGHLPQQGRRSNRRFSGDPNGLPTSQYGPGGAQGAQQGGQQGSPHLQGMYAREGSSAEEASRQIDQQHEQQRLASINTLKSVFPGLEDEVLEMVLLSNSGDMAKTIDALLEMS